MPRHDSSPAKWSTADLLAMSALAPLAGPYLPWTVWTMSPGALVSIINEIYLKQRRSVVELGCGTSTVLIARALRETGGHLTSVDHDRVWADNITELLRREELDATAAITVAELVDVRGGDETVARAEPPPAAWYDSTALERQLPDEIDLLIVDGPPAGRKEIALAREPAAAFMQPRLDSAGFTIVLDDANRPGETEIIPRWESLLGIEFVTVPRLSLAIARSDGGFTPTM